MTDAEEIYEILKRKRLESIKHLRAAIRDGVPYEQLKFDHPPPQTLAQWETFYLHAYGEEP